MCHIVHRSKIRITFEGVKRRESTHEVIFFWGLYKGILVKVWLILKLLFCWRWMSKDWQWKHTAPNWGFNALLLAVVKWMRQTTPSWSKSFKEIFFISEMNRHHEIFLVYVTSWAWNHSWCHCFHASYLFFHAYIFWLVKDTLEEFMIFNLSYCGSLLWFFIQHQIHQLPCFKTHSVRYFDFFIDYSPI